MIELSTTGGVAVSLYTTSGELVLGAPESTTGNGSGTDPATLTVQRQIAGNTAYHRTVGSVPEVGATIISKHTLVAPATQVIAQYTSAARVGFPEVPTQIARAGIVDATGTYHPLLFGGQETGTCAFGQMVRTDPTRPGVVFEAGETIHVVIELASGNYGTGTLTSEVPAKAVLTGPFAGSIPKTFTQTAAGGPTGLYGLTTESDRPLSIVGVGDSFMDQGWFNRGAERNGLAWSDWSIWLDHTHTYVDPEMNDRMPLEGPIPYDVAFIGWGGNDRANPLPDWLRITIESWLFFQSTGQKIATKTLHPYTNSDDGWTSLEGQQLKYESQEPNRVARNDWLRDGAPLDPATDEPGVAGTTDARFIRQGHPDHPLAYPVFDEADTCETERNSGLWKFDGGAWTADGAHLSAHGNARMADAFTQWVADNLT